MSNLDFEYRGHYATAHMDGYLVGEHFLTSRQQAMDYIDGLLRSRLAQRLQAAGNEA